MGGRKGEKGKDEREEGRVKDPQCLKCVDASADGMYCFHSYMSAVIYRLQNVTVS